MVSSPEIKNIPLLPSGKSALGLPPSRAHKRGASRSSRTLGAGCDGRGSVRRARMRAGRMMLKRTAKSCRSDAPMLASSLREVAQATVSNKPGHREEREVSRKTIARGMPGLFRCTCGDYARVLCLISHARLWVHWAPGIPCALCFSGRTVFCKKLGRLAPRERGVVSEICCLKMETTLSDSSCPGLTRASTSCGIPENEDVDGRDI